MYRLFSLYKTRFNPLNGVSSRKNEVISRLFHYESCDLCNSTFKRYQSTHTNPSPRTRKVKKRRDAKKYTDLLMVTDKSTVEYKARITKLNPNDLKFLALTNLNLSELHKLKDMMRTNRFVEEHTYNDLMIIENVHANEAVKEESILPQPEVEQEDPIVGDTLKPEVENLESLETIPSSTFQPEVLEEETDELEMDEEPKDQDKAPAKTKQDVRLKQEIISKTLGSYIEMCCTINNPQRGLNALWSQKSRRRADHHPCISTIAPYNSLLRSFAAKGSFNKVQEVLKIARSDNISLNIQSYAIILECLGRISSGNSHLRQITMYVNELHKNGYSFDKIFNEVNFVHDQRNYVLKAIRAYDKQYIPRYKTPNLHYSNHLLNHLNIKKIDILVNKSQDDRESLIKVKDMQKTVQEQMDIEKLGYLKIKNIENMGDPTPEVTRHRESLKKLLESWEDDALKGFTRDLATLSAKRCHLSLEPYLRSIPPKEFITILVDEAIVIAQGSETYSPTAWQLFRELGKKVYARYIVLRKNKAKVLDKILKIHNNYCEDYVNAHKELDILPRNTVDVNSRQRWQILVSNLRNEGSSIDLDSLPWPPSILQQIGKFLYHIVMHDLKINVNIMRENSKHKNNLPAFYTVFRHQGRIVTEEVKPHPVLSKLYRASMPETLTFPAYQVPMKCPPVPWCTLSTGGYLVTPTEFVRLPLTAQAQKDRLELCETDQLYPSFDALNQLAAVPWKVNKRILDVILEVFRKGGSDKLNVPENPINLKPPPAATPNMDKLQRFQLFKERLQYRRKRSEMYSLWCDCLYRLSLANHFRDDIFWLPHNMDFRGRVYPVPPHFNHLGSDLARSMLVFAEARPLGPDGLKWLKLHLVNLTGLKKRDPIEERLKFADTILDKIFECADNPLKEVWWVESDEPWQTLSCTMEITNAIRSGDPEAYRSHFPVHQDGSCNGLQHYAALGRDTAGGFSVNLTPAPCPQDVYSAVAVLVENRRKEDEDKGLEIAKILNGFVRRKVIKQTVMTTVYGVTRYGARLQIARQLKDIDDFPKEHVWAGSSYLTTRTFESLRTMFTSTREIQDWFTECARLISSICSENVEWVTPLGLPVVQPYFRYKKLPQKSAYYEPFHIDKYEKPNVMKQKNAFPPNFIHSLDSSHMMLTSLNCERAGITFVSVHDCYWTHASTVHIMNKICREQFVALHSEPILENLSEFLAERYSFKLEDLTLDNTHTDLVKRKLNKILRKLPKTGDFNIKEVLDSVYFFS